MNQFVGNDFPDYPMEMNTPDDFITIETNL